MPCEAAPPEISFMQCCRGELGAKPLVLQDRGFKSVNVLRNSQKLSLEMSVTVQQQPLAIYVRVQNKINK